MKKTLIITILALLIATHIISATTYSTNADGTTYSGGYGGRNGLNVHAATFQGYAETFNWTGPTSYDINYISTKLNRSGTPGSGDFVEISVYPWNGTSPTGTPIKRSLPVAISDLSLNGSRVKFNFTANTSLPLTGGALYMAVINSNMSGTSGYKVFYGASYANGTAYFSSDDAVVDDWASTGAGPFGGGPTDLDFEMQITDSLGSVLPTIVLNNQQPANITTSTIFNQNIQISYNYTNSSFTNQLLVYNITRTSGDTCFQYINGSCIANTQNNFNVSPSTWTNVTGIQTINYTLGENDVYPSIANLPYVFFTQTPTAYTPANSNSYIKIELQNLTTNVTTYNVLEFMANATLESRVYACNSSYTTGAVTTSSNCIEIGLINTTTYNHSHSSNSAHNLVSFIIDGGKININGITATPNMQFLIRGTNAGVTNVYYVVNNSRSGATQTTANNGVTWTTQTYTPNSHLHQFTGTASLNYKAVGNITSTFWNSTVTTEALDLSTLPPTAPQITNPLDTIQATRYLNITWTQSFPFLSSIKIQNYTVNLLNSDQTFNSRIFINNNATLFYYWDVYAWNLSTGVYYIQVVVNDSLGQVNEDRELFNLTRNALLNITWKNSLNGSIVGTGNATLLFGSNTEIYNTTTGKSSINIIKSTAYNITSDFQGYSYDSQIYTSNATFEQFLNISLYTNNSVNVNIYDETTGTLITTDNITVVFTGTIETTNITSTGLLYVDSLPEGNYTVKLSGTTYTLKQYTITVGGRSHQVLNAYLSSATGTTTFTLQDFDSNAELEGASLTQSRLINGTWTTINSKLSDITGRVQFTYLPNVKYRFQASLTGYDTQIFDLDPVLFSSYTVRLTRQATRNEGNTPDYDTITVVYYPVNFTTNTTHILTWTITAPVGNLINYTLNTTGPGGLANFTSGTNSYGGTIIQTLIIPAGTNLTDQIRITYCYTETGLSQTCKTVSYTIIGSISDFTWIKNKDRLAGVGLLEKTIVGTIIVAGVGGVAFMLGPFVGAAGIIFAFGLTYYLGFFSLWLILIGILLGFLYIGRGERL